MDIALALANSLMFGLKLLNTKESRKYLDEVIDLKKKRDYEINKPEGTRNLAIIDNIDRRLCIISESIAQFGTQNALDS